MKVLVIERAGQWRELLRHHLTTAWEDVEITELDPAAATGIADGFGGAGHDLILIGVEPNRQPGPEWIARHSTTERFPPVIALADKGDELFAVAAMKAGAADYLPKSHLRHAALIAAVRAATEAREGAQDAAPVSLQGHELKAMKGHRVLRLLHSSDVSVVHLAREEDSGELRVFKIYRHSGDNSRVHATLERFLGEYQLLAGLRHPNVVRIHDLGIADDHVFIAMEHLSGGTLRRRVSAGMTPAQAVDALRQLARALQAIHDAGVLHRDLKPGNVMLREDGSLALIDFGLARELRSHAGLTDEGGRIFGTPLYMSPEQGHGDGVTERSDIYSLGVMFYEMLTGERPFAASSPMAVIYRHRNDPRPQLPDHLGALQPLLDRMLAADPEARFASAAELVEAVG